MLILHCDRRRRAQLEPVPAADPVRHNLQLDRFPPVNPDSAPYVTHKSDLDVERTSSAHF
jgi:hypothetical protein